MTDKKQDEKLQGIFGNIEEMVVKAVQKEIDSLGLSFKGEIKVKISPENNRLNLHVGVNAALTVSRKGNQIAQVPLVGEATSELLPLPYEITIPLEFKKP